jgi:hypothetical protein
MRPVTPFMMMPSLRVATLVLPILLADLATAAS